MHGEVSNQGFVLLVGALLFPFKFTKQTGVTSSRGPYPSFGGSTYHLSGPFKVSFPWYIGVMGRLGNCNSFDAKAHKANVLLDWALHSLRASEIGTS